MTFPTIRPALTLDFAKTQLLDPRITFSRSSDGTYVGSDGLIKTAPDGVARFKYDSNGKCLGLLIEESKTNQFTYSEDFSNAAWLKTLTSVTASSGTSPDGTSNASLLEATGTTNCYIRQTFATTGTVTISCFAKAGTASFTAFYVNGALGYFDLSTGTVGTVLQDQGTTTASIESLSNGWYHCSMTTVATANNDKRIYVTAADNSVNTTIGDNIYIWGAQLEDESLTSYIPTVAATVTRAVDLATMPTAGIYGDEFTTINKDFGTASTGTTVSIIGPNTERTVTYPAYLTQTEINEVAGREAGDDFWRWRVLGFSFALPNFTTDGQVTVDWGDGTVEVLTTAEHTFTDGAGYHEIGFRLDSGTRFEPKINADVTHKDKLVAVGPAPASMAVDLDTAFFQCTNLKVVDPTADFSGANAWTNAFRNCSSLTSFPFVDTTNVTLMNSTWRGCSALTSFPLLDTSSVQNITSAWYDCSSLTSFPAIDTSSATSFSSTWTNCSGLTSFPFVNSSIVVNFTSAWLGCSSLTSFPAIDTSGSAIFANTWYNCSGLTSFPLIDTSIATSFSQTWRNCSGLTSFPAIDCSNVESCASTWKGCTSLSSFPSVSFVNATTFVRAWENCGIVNFPAGVFDSWTGTPADSCFAYTWYNCNAMSAASVENILNSIDTSGQSAPATGVDITIDYNAASGTPNITTAVTNLKSRSWTITLNGVAQ